MYAIWSSTGIQVHICMLAGLKACVVDVLHNYFHHRPEFAISGPGLPTSTNNADDTNGAMFKNLIASNPLDKYI